jgi:outer membrane lipoprotein-sorting protein
VALWTASLASLAVLVGGCEHISTKTNVPAAQVPHSLDATKAELIEKYNKQAAAIQSLNATVTLTPTAGSQYSGVIEQYHEVNGFILAARPANIRVIGQAPVVAKNVFDMVSDGETFRIYIPSKNKFITGPARFEKKAEKPIENLRPQHLVDALFWREIPAGAPVIFEEMEDAAGRAYLLTVLRRGDSEGNFIIESNIRFDRSDLNVAEIENFTGEGILTSVSRYSDWQAAGAAQFPRSITVSRPRDDYKLAIQIKKLALNETIAPERFHLEQPAGSELVEVGKDDKGAQP